MRWVSYRHEAGTGLGLVVGEVAYCLAPGTRLVDLLASADDMAEAGERAMRDPVEVTPLASLSIAGLLEPPSIRDFVGFLQHARNARRGGELDDIWYEEPAFYFSNPAAVIGGNDPVPVSPLSEMFDYELEVAAVIGPTATNVSVDRAEAHIAGYTIMCDWSARDLQMREAAFGLGPAKGKDGATTLGPMLVTPDELEAHRTASGLHLEMMAWVNGVQLTAGFLDEMEWSFPELVAFAARGTTLRPGDVIGSGTVPRGCLLEHWVLDGADAFAGWLQPGDQVRLVVEGLGEVDQVVVAGAAAQALRARR